MQNNCNFMDSTINDVVRSRSYDFLRYSWWFDNHAKYCAFVETDFCYLGGWSHCTCEGQKNAPGIGENKCFICLFLLLSLAIFGFRLSQDQKFDFWYLLGYATDIYG